MDSLAEDLFKSILVIGKDLECAICLSLLKDATSLRCNHSFCSKCLNGLLQSNNRQEVSCPTCKSISTVKKSLEGIGKRDDKLNNLVSIYKRLQPKTHSRVHPNGEPVEFSQVANFLDLDSTSIMKENISENSSSSNIIDLDQNKKNSDFDASLEMERLNEKTSAGSNSVNATVSKQTKRKSKQSNNKIEGKSYNPDVDEPQSKTLLLESNLDELSIKNELAKDLLDLACSERLSMVDGCDDATSSSNGSGSITSSNVTKQSKLLNKDQSLSTKKKKSDNLLLNNFKTTTPSSSRNQVDENARNLLFNNDAVFATPVALNEGVKTTPRTILVSMPSADSRNEQQIKENENKTPDTILVNNNLKSVVSSGDGNNNINIRDFQSSNVIENKTPDTVLVNNHSKRVVVSSADSSYNTNNNINPKLNENKTPDTILVNNNSKTAASSVDSYNQKLNENKTPDTVMVTNNLKSIVSSAGSNDNNVNNKSNYIRKDSLHSISSSSSNENHSVSLKESSSKRGRPSKSRIMNILVNVDNNNDNDNHKNDNDNINARLDSSSDPRKHVTPQETSTKFKKKKIKISPISFDVTTPPQHVGSINNCVDNNKNDNENSASLGETIRPFNNIGEIESVPSKTTNKDDVAISILNESNHESINDALKTSNDVGINILNANNENEIDRIKENDGAIVASSTNNDVAIIPSQPIKKDPYRIGAVVTVKRRMGPGENKPGGVAVIKSRNFELNTFNVRYVINGTSEKNVLFEYITPGIDIDNDSLMGNSSQASKSPQSNKNNEVNNNKKLKHNLNKTPILSNESNPNVSKAYSIPSNEAEINNKMSENSVAEKNKKKSPPSHQSSFVKNSSSNKKDVIDKGETQSMKNNNLKETINIKKETDLIGINFNEINNKNESVSTKYDEAKNIKGNEPIIMPTFGTLGRSEKKHYLENLNLAVEKFGGKIVEEEDSIHLVTHCLVPCSLEHFEMNEIQLKEMNEFNQFDLLQMNPTSFKNENKLQIVVALSRTMKYMNAISLGKLIIDQKWVVDSLKANEWLPLNNYLVSTDVTSLKFNLNLFGPGRARKCVNKMIHHSVNDEVNKTNSLRLNQVESNENKSTLLFNEQVMFYFFGDFGKKLKKHELNYLIHNCGGSLINDLSELDCFGGKKTMNSNSNKLFLICKDENEYLEFSKIEIKNQIKQLKTNLFPQQTFVLRLDWLFHSVSTYCIVDWNDYQISI